MPRIPDWILGCAIYLYPTPEDAQRGSRVGGTGVLIGEPLGEARPDPAKLYAVTNKHVANGFGTIPASPVIRLHRKDGTPLILPKSQADWYFHPSGDDLAICPLGLTTTHNPLLYIEPVTTFVTPERIFEEFLGIGNTVYVVGRYINLDGGVTNEPSLRFGHIAMMPSRPIYNPALKNEQESIVIDTRMRGGYSGSPVFVLVYAHERPYAPTPPDPVRNSLLGVLWGFLWDEPALIRERKTRANRISNLVVDQNAGLAAVVPAWKILDLLTLPAVGMAQEALEQQPAVAVDDPGTATSPDGS